MVVFVFLFFLLLAGYGVLIEFYRRAWNDLPGYSAETQAETSVSLVIALRNEEANIAPLLASLEKIVYPASLFEVVLADDHSEDGTWQALSAYAPAGTRITLVRNAAGITGKKAAITAGVAAATGELIITSDADCRFQPGWVNTMASFYRDKQAKFIAAPVNMESPRSLLGIFQCLDFLTLQGISGASVYKRFHTMCNGANLAYEKKTFIDAGGFEGIDHIPSGDDMLLMHKIYKQYPNKVFYLKSAEAIVNTSAEQSWKSFFHQRLRWASKAVHYEDKRIFYVLLLTYLVNASFLAMAVACIWNRSYIFLLILFFLAKIIIEFPFVNAVAIFFGRQKLMAYFALLQPLHILYTVVAGWLGRFGQYEWKSRIIKNNPRRNG